MSGDPTTQLKELAQTPPLGDKERRMRVAPGVYDHDSMVKNIREGGGELRWLPRSRPGVRFTPEDLPPVVQEEGKEPPKAKREWVHVRPMGRRVLAYGDAEHPLVLYEHPDKDGQYPKSVIPGIVIAEDVIFTTQHPDEPRILFDEHRLYKSPQGLADIGERVERDARAVLYTGKIKGDLGTDHWADQTYRAGEFTTGYGTTVVRNVDLSNPTGLTYEETHALCPQDPYALIDAYDIPMPAAPTTTSGPELAAAA